MAISVELRRFLSFPCIFIVVVSRNIESFVVNHRDEFRSPIRSPSDGRHRSLSTLLAHQFLTSAVERLASERCQSQSEYYHYLNWFDPSVVDDAARTRGDKDDSRCTELPLYPLSAVYLPHPDINHTLINIEPRNLQMARDLLLLKQKSDDRLFCVTLRAFDTGRLATVGTVLQIVDCQTQMDMPESSLKRIVLTCVAKQVVDIVKIQNPLAASWESRIRRSSEYLRAKVKPRDHASIEPNSESDAEILKQVAEDYSKVRELYVKKDSQASKELPWFSREKIEQAFPDLSSVNLTTSDGIWRLASVWQTLCYTVREGRQIQLSSNRNELLVAAAMRKGGPLELPIHVESVLPSDRQAVEDLEAHAHREWLDVGLDPCLDFQILIRLQSDQEQLRWLGRLIARERQRLEVMERHESLLLDTSDLSNDGEL